jgi:hypothetical protein
VPTGFDVEGQGESNLLKEVQDRLWTERHLLEFLLFKLITAKLILGADDRRFMSPALAEVEHVVEKIRLAEMERSLAVARLADDWGVGAHELSLKILAGRASEPYKTIFNEHREGFLRLTGEIEEVALENRRLASASLADIQSSLDTLMGTAPEQSPPTYDDKGRRRADPTTPRRLDAAL